MLIRVRGAAAGIKAYLELGQKDGREFSRHELDERVILAGDLSLTDTIINDIAAEGDRYLHVTLAFKEDALDRETLRAVTEDFRAFALSAYRSDEYNFYAEAHLPRIKSYIDKRTGEHIERKPHIHIVIPKTNLLSGTRLDPLYRPMLDRSGSLLVPEAQMRWLEAFQEHCNDTYGLASPKDNPRVTFTDESTVIARYKGDLFKGANREIKEQLVTEMMDRGITRYEDFQALVAEHGEVRVRRGGRGGEYLNLKRDPAGKGLNLKEHVFTKSFIELSAAEKRSALAKEAQNRYVEPGPTKPSSAERDELLSEWHEVRARELKYINSGSRKRYAEYLAADRTRRIVILDEREKSFYAKHEAKEKTHDNNRGRTPDRNRDRKPDPQSPARAPPSQTRHRLRSVSECSVVQLTRGGAVLLPGDASDHLEHEGTERHRGVRRNARGRPGGVTRGPGTSGGPPRSLGELRQLSDVPELQLDGQAVQTPQVDSVVTQHLRDQAQTERSRAAMRQEFDRIKRELGGHALLAHLARSHGVTPGKYAVERSDDGTDRIKAGTRRLNVTDFVTKELHLPWDEAAQVLRRAYAAQPASRSPVDRGRATATKALWEEYQRIWRPKRRALRDTAWDAQRSSEQTRRAELRERLQIAKQSVRATTSTRAARRAALSLARMEKVASDMALRNLIADERKALKARFDRRAYDEYALFLMERTQEGDVRALRELRRRARSDPGTSARNRIKAVTLLEDEDPPTLLRRARFVVDAAGRVTYLNRRAEMFTDTGRAIEFISTDKEVLEAGLRMAIAKWGEQVKLEGSDAFKALVAEIAAEAGIRVSFFDDKLQAARESRKLVLKGPSHSKGGKRRSDR